MPVTATTLPIRGRKPSTEETTPQVRGGRGYKPFPEADDDEWRSRAACLGTDPDLWFPASACEGRRVKHRPGLAEAICADCPVRVDCAAEQRRSRSKSGIWAGEIASRRA